MEENKIVNMGMGKLGESNTVIHRKFRWLLWADNLVPDFCKNVGFDYKNKTISFEYIDIVTDKDNENALIWSQNLDKGILPKETMVFSTLDGCGKETSRTGFKGLSLISHESSFDYASSEPSVQKITVSYQEILLNFSPVEKPKVEVDFWTIEFKELDDSTICSRIPLKIKSRPQIEIEEVDLNFLNAKSWIPGKTRWEKLSGEINKKFRETIEKAFFSRYLPNDKIKATLNHNKGDKILESWELNGVWLLSYLMKSQEEKCIFELMFDKAVYKDTQKKS